MEINIGVPQGLYLWPLLFILFIKDLPQAVQYSTIAMYADDISLSYRSSCQKWLPKGLNVAVKRQQATCRQRQFVLLNFLQFQIIGASYGKSSP